MRYHETGKPADLLLDLVARMRFPFKMLRQPGQARHIGRWLRSLQPDYLLRQGMPWLVFDVLDYLDQYDLRGRRVCEFGSGGSTLYWLRRGAQLISVEHDPAWYARVQARIPREAMIDYRLVPAHAAGVPDDERLQAYVAQIDHCADHSLDLVLVDGLARTACLRRAAPKVRPGGLLVLDNSDRPAYTATLGASLAAYQALVLRGACPCVPLFSQTTIYQRQT
jgi:hypothetical protein